MMIYQVKEEEGGVHSVTRDMLVTARRKAKYREKVIADVHKRLYNTYEDSGWWIFKRKKSQFDIIISSMRYISEAWDYALYAGYITTREHSILKRNCFTVRTLDAMLQATSCNLSTKEMITLRETLDIKEPSDD